MHPQPLKSYLISFLTCVSWFIADEDVLDTWFSSGLFPFSIFGWPEEVSYHISCENLKWNFLLGVECYRRRHRSCVTLLGKLASLTERIRNEYQFRLSLTFSRAWTLLLISSLSSHWLLGLCTFIMISCCSFEYCRSSGCASIKWKYHCRRNFSSLM